MNCQQNVFLGFKIVKNYMTDKFYNQCLQRIFITKFSMVLFCFIQFRYFATEHSKQLVLPKCRRAVPSHGGRHIVTMIPGGGIGWELTNCVRDIFALMGVPIDFEVLNVTSKKEMLDAVTSMQRNTMAIVGSMESEPKATSKPYIRHTYNASFRNRLDLYVNYVHCKSYPNVRSKYKNIDLLLIRQNSEGYMSQMEHTPVKGVVESLKVITRKNSERVARFAFEFAKVSGRNHMTIVHKASRLKMSDELFLNTIRDVGRDYREIKFNDMNVDEACAQLILNPYQFDVILSTNIYGMVITNVACGLIGGPGLTAGINYSNDCMVFETATRSTGWDIFGRDIANPVGMLNAGISLLHHLHLNKYANILKQAIYKTTCIDRVCTADIGGTYKTSDVIENILQNISWVSDRHFSSKNVANN